MDDNDLTIHEFRDEIAGDSIRVEKIRGGSLGAFIVFKPNGGDELPGNFLDQGETLDLADALYFAAGVRPGQR